MNILKKIRNAIINWRNKKYYKKMIDSVISLYPDWLKNDYSKIHIFKPIKKRRV